MSRRVGILGGTFDPVHFGHLRTAEEALEALDFDSLLFVPAADPPHKSQKKIAPFKHRWRMLQLAVQGNARFQISDLEQRLSGKSYTVVTLNKLLEAHPGKVELYFLVGMDSFLELDTWWHYRELFQLARMVVARRPGYPEEVVESFLQQKVSSLYAWDRRASVFKHPDFHPTYYLETTCMGISSTQIRQLLSKGRSIRYLVPQEIMSYIKEKQLYGSDRS
jgi:nicotinate-nucleotide adenylyltransferase